MSNLVTSEEFARLKAKQQQKPYYVKRRLELERKLHNQKVMRQVRTKEPRLLGTYEPNKEGKGGEITWLD